jgi:membrane-associated phospholipid phosphatase
MMNQKAKKAKSFHSTTPFDTVFFYATRPWIVIVALVFFYISYQYIDIPILQFFHTDFIRGHHILEAVSKYPLPKWYLWAAIVIALIARYVIGNKRFEYSMWFIALCEFVPGTLCHFLKTVLGRARPEMWITDSEYGFYGLSMHGDAYRSFPSGHASAIMGLMVALGIIYPKRAWLLWSLGLLWSFMRTVVSCHYFSDVWVGAYLDVLEIGVLMLFLRSTRFMKIVQGA